MQKEIGGLGTDVLFIWPDYRSTQGKGAAASLTGGEDAEALLRDGGCGAGVAIVSTYVVMKNGNINNQVEVSGVAQTMARIRNRKLARGDILMMTRWCNRHG